MLTRCVLVIALLALCSTTQGAVTTYNTQAGFLDALSGPTGTEDFESFSTFPGALGGQDVLGLTLNFGSINTGSVTYETAGPTAGLNPDAFISNWTYVVGGDVPGSQYLNADHTAIASLTVNFDAPVSAFGFFLYDAGDTGPAGTPNPEDYELILDNGEVVTIPTLGNGNGSAQYFGVIDDMGSFTSATFDQQYLADLYGVDDLTVQNFVEMMDPVTPDPVDPGPAEPGPPSPPPPPSGEPPAAAVPEPASFAVWGALLLSGLVGLRIKRR